MGRIVTVNWAVDRDFRAKHFAETGMLIPITGTATANIDSFNDLDRRFMFDLWETGKDVPWNVNLQEYTVHRGIDGTKFFVGKDLSLPSQSIKPALVNWFVATMRRSYQDAVAEVNDKN